MAAEISSNARGLVMNAVKMGLVACLFAWLISTGKLDFNQLKVLIEDPRILLFSVGIWTGGSVLLGTVRWYLLVRGAGLEVRLARALQMQLIGLFFNTAMPGSVGGDIIKAVYVIREQTATRRAAAMLTVLLDRLIGLAALFVIAGIAMVANQELLARTPALRPMAVFVGLGLTAIIAVFLWVSVPFFAAFDPMPRLLKLRIPGIGLIAKIYDAMRTYRSCPRVLVYALLLSILIQGASLTFVCTLVAVINHITPPVLDLGVVFPLAVMTTALPLAPGGLGVGHVAFDQLFHLIGLSGGANIFNVMVLGQLSLNMLGFIPYLLFRGNKLPNGANAADSGADSGIGPADEVANLFDRPAPLVALAKSPQ